MKAHTPKPTTTPAQTQAQADEAQKPVQTAASTAMNLGGPVALEAFTPSEDLLKEFAPSLRGAAKSAATGAVAVKNYDWDNDVTQPLPLTDANAIALCEYHDVALVEADEPEIKGRWDWVGQGCACDVSLETQGEAAQDAVKCLGLEFPTFSRTDWEIEAGQGNTRIGYADWVLHQEEMHGFTREVSTPQMSAHSEGPWSVQTPWGRGDGMEEIRSAEGEWICDVRIEDERDRANVALLLAAPEMKNILARMVEVFAETAEADSRETEFVVEKDVLACARLVLARTEGVGTSHRPVGNKLETSGPGMADLRIAIEEMWAQVAENPSFNQDDRLRAAAIDMRVKFAMVSGTPEDISYWKMRQNAEMALAGKLGQTTAKWIERLESSDVEADLFDDLLHDLYAPDDAAEINNGGIHRQVPALISALGLKDAHDHIEKAVQENGFPEFGLPYN